MSRLLLIPAILALLLVVLFTGQPASAQFDRGVFLGLTQVGITVTASLYDGD